MFRGKGLLASAALLVLTLALVAVLLSKGIPSGSSGPATGLHPTPSPILSPTPVPAFKLVITSPLSGQILSQGVQIACTGTYTGQNPPYVWVVLQDTIGQYYLQNPPVEFHSDGTWIARNIRPGQGIIQIAIVQVTSAGNALFQQKVSNGDFGSLNQLPLGTTTLAVVSVQVQ